MKKLTLSLYVVYTVAIISRHPKFFMYNFHCKQQNFMKFQQEAYQDMRNMANDASDQKFGNIIKTNCQNDTIKKFV